MSNKFSTKDAGLKKKKKTPVELSSLHDESLDAAYDLDEQVNDEEDAEGIGPWEGSHRDYIYDESLLPMPIEVFVPQIFFLACVNVLWDLDDFPIPESRAVFSVADCLRVSIMNSGYINRITITVHTTEKLSQNDLSRFDYAIVEVVKSESLDAKREKIISSIREWKLDHPYVPTSLMLLSKDCDPYVAALNFVKEHETNILLATDTETALPDRILSIPSLIWSWSSILDGGDPTDLISDLRSGPPIRSSTPRCGGPACILCPPLRKKKRLYRPFVFKKRKRTREATVSDGQDPVSKPKAKNRKKRATSSLKRKATVSDGQDPVTKPRAKNRKKRATSKKSLKRKATGEATLYYPKVPRVYDARIRAHFDHC